MMRSPFLGMPFCLMPVSHAFTGSFFVPPAATSGGAKTWQVRNRITIRNSLADWIFRRIDIQSLEAERDAAVEKNAADYSWVDAFKKYEGIERVERQVVVNLISEIRVYEGNVVEIDFQHNDAIEAALKIIDTLPEDMKTEA